MIDAGREEADRILEELELRISREYRNASIEVRQKLNDYLRRFEAKNRIKQDQLTRGIITQKEYKEWLKGQLIVGERWQALRDELSLRYANASARASNLIHGTMPSIYAQSHNYATYLVEHGARINTSYTLYDVPTIRRLIRDNPQMLPPPGRRTQARINQGLDVRWNNQRIQSVMTQSIMQGESIPNIATRLANEVGDSNRKAAIRNARTMTTGAENAGRVDGFKRAEEMGIKMKQTWVAVLDKRTRYDHRYLDGMSVPVGEPWETQDGTKINFPGDPECDDPGQIYNCRCTVIADIEGFEHDTGARDDPGYGDMSYDDWKAEHKSESNPIDLPEQVAEDIRMQFIGGYRR